MHLVHRPEKRAPQGNRFLWSRLVSELYESVGYCANDGFEIAVAAFGGTSVGAIGIAVDFLPGTVTLVAIGGVEISGIGVPGVIAMGALGSDELGPQGEHHRGFEDAGMARQTAAEMRLDGDQSVPGDGPIGCGGDAGGELESNIARGELG